MDRVEVARQAAARLHAAAVARGLDPWSPYEFAVAEARRRDLDVEPTASGAALLNKGRAAYLPDDALILHENVGTLFERAFLVAHELGHAELGDGPDPGYSAGGDSASDAEPARVVDPARSAEPAPMGVDRVVDYGRRQRREVQMDLFAREFLLPRPVVRRLHVEDGLSASAIAARLGAPFAVVAQQLLDALLLPVVVLREEADWPDRPLNPRQAAAAQHRGNAFLLEAGPGTGKTQTLVGRVQGLLDEGVDPRRILLLTFSNKAAGEMADRIARRRQDAAGAMWIGTFHAFGLDVVRRFHGELGLPKNPCMMDRVEAAELLEHEFPRLGLAHYRNVYDPTQIVADVLAAISRAKDEVVDADGYAALASAMLRAAATAEERETAERALEVARVYAAYEALKRRADRVDFGDLVALPVRLLDRDSAVRAHLGRQYDHVLVDEYQDVNRASVRLLAALRADGRNLWAVGDGKQSVYRFRGASSFNMARFGTADFVGGSRDQLTTNYRSVEAVVGACSAFAREMRAGRSGSGLSAERGTSAHAPELATVLRAEQQPVALADAIEAMRQAGHPYRDQAVLCTGNEKLSTLGQDLERLGVPVLFLGSLFERAEVKDLLALLSVLADRWAMGLLRVASWPEFAMPITDVSAVLQHLRERSDTPNEWMSHLDAIADVSDQGRAGLGALAAALAGFDEASDPWTVLATVLLDRTRAAANVAAAADVSSRTRGIAMWQLMNFLRAQPAGDGPPVARVLDRVRRLVRLGDDRELRQLPAAAQGIDAVRLMTIHGAKGLEFAVVHVPGVNADTIPRSAAKPPCPPPEGMVEGGDGGALAITQAAHAEEQECLFYVALSRARDRLFLYAPTQKSNGHNRPLSPFLDRLGPGLVRRQVTPARVLPPDPESADVALVLGEGLRFTDAQIGLYELCPRRFFYTHVLEVGGRRTATAYTRMHEAVRTLANGVIAQDRTLTGDEDLEQRIGEAFATYDLVDHGYVGEYRTLARAMVRYLVSIRAGHTPAPRTGATLVFGEDQIVVRPDDVVVRSDGARVLRRVKTGHLRSTESKGVAAAAFVLAAREAFPDAVVEFVHLGDEAARPQAMSPKELQNRREKLAGFLRDVRAGRFPANGTPRTCAGCPAFFVCGPTPPGALPLRLAGPR